MDKSAADLSEEIYDLCHEIDEDTALSALINVIIEILTRQPTDRRYELARILIRQLHEYSTPGTA